LISPSLHAENFSHNSFQFTETPAPYFSSQNINSAAVAGGSLGSIATLAQAQTHAFAQIINQRQNKLHSFSHTLGSSEVFFGEADDPKGQERANEILETIGKVFGIGDDTMGAMPQIWFTDMRSGGRLAASNSANNYHYDLNGVAGGADLKLDTDWSLGFAGGYNRTNSTFEQQGITSTAVDGYHAALYATFERGKHTIDNQFNFSFFRDKSVRSLNQDNTATANADTYSYQMGWTLSAMTTREWNQFAFTPITGFTLSHLHTGKLSERGGGAMDLAAEINDRYSLKPMVGLNIAHRMNLPSGLNLVPEVYGIYRYEMFDTVEDASTHFSNYDYATLRSDSTKLSRHSFQFGGGLGMEMTDKLTAKLQLDTDMQPSSHEYRGMFKLNYAW
jgi:outer membrane autotransporter protein